MRADAFLPARSQPRVPTVDCDEVVLGDHLLHFQAQRVGKIPDEVDKIVAAFRELLEPLSASVASAFGFTSVQITTDIQTGLGLNALKALGKNVNAIFAQSFGYPRVQAVTLEAHPDPATGYRFTWYTTTGPSLFAAQLQMQPVAANVLDLNSATTLPPASGTNGIGLSYVRKFP